MAMLPSDVVGVVAEFLPPETQYQLPLMLVNQTWFHGVVGQHGMQPLPRVRWPLVALRYRNESQCVSALRLSPQDGCDKDALWLTETSLPSLHTMVLASCSKISDAALMTLAASPQISDTLTCLNVSGCYQLTDAAVAQHIATFHNLRSLHLCGLIHLTDGAMEPLLANMKHLTTLDIGGCCQITDKGVKSIAAQLEGHSLTSLNLVNCCEIKDVSMKRIGERLSTLTSLNISACENISDRGMEQLKGLKKLTTLDISGCFRISKKTNLVNLIALKRVDVSCTKIDADALQKKMPDTVVEN